MNKKPKNPFLTSAQITSPDSSFNEYLYNASYSYTSEDSSQILTSLRSTDSVNLKSVIFYLAIRKAYKNSALRYSKFSFYLMRSLYKETLSRSIRHSFRYSKITKEKKQILNKIQKIIQVQKDKKLKHQIFNFCKEFPRVKLARIKRIETVTRVFAIFYKSIKKSMFKCLQVLKGPTKAERLLNIMQKFLYKYTFLNKRVSHVTVRVYGFLQKPKHNLPYVKFAPKPVAQRSISPVPVPRAQWLIPEPRTDIMSKKPEISRMHQRGVIRLCVLNRNYLVVKKKAFYKLTEIVNWYRKFAIKNKAQSFKTRIDSLLRNSFINIAFRIVSVRRDLEYFQFLTQVLGFVKYKCENNLVAHAFEAIYNSENRLVLEPSKLKYIYNFLRIVNTKIFNKRFFGFILIKGYSKLKASTKKINQLSVNNLANVLKKLTKNFKLFAVDKLIEHSKYENYLDNFCDFMNLLKKIYNRTRFYKQLETFDTIVQYSNNRKRSHFSVASKILFIIRKRYTKLTALAFL